MLFIRTGFKEVKMGKNFQTIFLVSVGLVMGILVSQNPSTSSLVKKIIKRVTGNSQQVEAVAYEGEDESGDEGEVLPLEEAEGEPVVAKPKIKQKAKPESKAQSGAVLASALPAKEEAPTKACTTAPEPEPYFPQAVKVRVKGGGANRPIFTTPQKEVMANSMFPVISASATPKKIRKGEASTLNWSSAGASMVSMYNTRGVLLDQFDPRMNISVHPNVTTAYVFVAKNQLGEARSKVTVFVE